VSRRKIFETVRPIDDVLTALDLLYRRWGDNSTREVNCWHAEPFIEIGYHHDFADSSYYRYRVTPRLVAELIERHLVKGKPQWGYTDYKTLSISEVGGRLLWAERERLEISNENNDRFVDWRGASWRRLLAMSRMARVKALRCVPPASQRGLFDAKRNAGSTPEAAETNAKRNAGSTPEAAETNAKRNAGSTPEAAETNAKENYAKRVPPSTGQGK
jgi:hypothetical protein